MPESLREIMAKGRKNKRSSSSSDDSYCSPQDPYAPAISTLKYNSSPFSFFYDSEMTLHFNPNDSQHIENPERISRTYKRCLEFLKEDNNILRIPTRKATNEELKLVHTQDLIHDLTELSKNGKDPSFKYRSIYLNENSLNSARIAAGGAIDLAKSVYSGQSKSGFALIRPPGHHACSGESSGFCLFNNVALAAKSILAKNSSTKILIVDLDVHHGQATQREFIENENVLYFSIHRFEYGKFWPNLKESNFDVVGKKNSNVNIPLNETGLGDSDYLAILHRILLPLAYEFRPDITLVSMGYDASVGDPEGEMNVTPAFYGHVARHLMSLGKIAFFLEGGYFLESLEESVAATLSALKGENVIPLTVNQNPIPQSLIESLNNVLTVHKNRWNQLNLKEIYDEIEINENFTENFIPNFKFLYKDESEEIKTPAGFVAGSDYFIHTTEKFKEFSIKLTELKKYYETFFKSSGSVGYVYDEFLTKHLNVRDEDHPETPGRIKAIHSAIEEFGLIQYLIKIPSRKVFQDEVYRAHGRVHNNNLLKLKNINNQEDRNDFEKAFNSVYFNEWTHECSLLASGALLELTDAVCSNRVRSGVAVIRPPGHHAEPNNFMGFSILNNVAIAAKHASINHGVKKILILDWDVHHGNGIQKIFYSDPSVLYISLHRFDGGIFFPGNPDGGSEFVGEGPGQGFNVNIPWEGSGHGDPEYLAAFFNLIMPIAYEFNPDLVFVAAGFDAAVNDPLGYSKVSPQMFGHMTYHLRNLAQGKVILSLEGGYNLKSISLSMVMCTKALLDQPIPMPIVDKPIKDRASRVIRNVLKQQSKYWKSLNGTCFKLPKTQNQDMEALMSNLSITKNEEDYLPSEYGVSANTTTISTWCSSPSSIQFPTSSTHSAKNE